MVGTIAGDIIIIAPGVTGLKGSTFSTALVGVGCRRTVVFFFGITAVSQCV